MDRNPTDPHASSLSPGDEDALAAEPGSALFEALDPARGETALGDDPRAPALLEVTQLWSGTILSVRHFAPSGRPVTLADRPPRRVGGLAAVVVAGFVAAVTVLALLDSSVSDPPAITPDDEALIAAWGAEREVRPQASAETEQTAQRAPAPWGDPLSALVASTRARLERELTSERRAMDAGRAERRLLSLPPFHLDEQPGWLAFVADELLAPARDRAAAGTLPSHWRAALEAVPAHFDVLDQPEVARVAEDLPRGSLVRRRDDEGPWTLTSGLDPDVVTLAHEDGRRLTLPPREALWPWVPTSEATASLDQLAREAAEVLYADALARQASRATCEGAERLLGFLDQGGRAELQARAAWCALHRGQPETARHALALASGPPDLRVDPDAEGVLLRSRARLARLDLAAVSPGDRAARRAARDRARTALLALRAHVVSIQRSPSDLRAVSADLQAVAIDELHEQRERRVRAAGGLGVLVLLLLPAALVFDERRARRTAGDFFVDGDALPVDPFPLVTSSPQGPMVQIPDGAQTWVRSDGVARAASGDVPLAAGEQLVTSIGGATFVVQQVRASRAVRAEASRLDWGYLSVLAALLMISGAFTVVLATADPPPDLSVQDPDARIVRIALTQPDPPTPSVDRPHRETDAGEGARAAGDEGQRGTREATRPKARGMRVAVRREQHNREMVRTQGLLGAIERMDGGVFGDDGLSREVATATAGLIGTQYGDQRGDGFAARGDGGGGGCMSEDCGPELLSGVGTRERGRGRLGPGRDPGDVGTKGESAPRVGLADPLVLGSIDKATVDRIVRQHLPQVRRCYEQELGRNPDLAGKLSVKFVISRSGDVSQATSRSDTLGSPAVASCVHARFLRMRFPAPKGDGIVVVSYPLVFDAR